MTTTAAANAQRMMTPARPVFSRGDGTVVRRWRIGVAAIVSIVTEGLDTRSLLGRLRLRAPARAGQHGDRADDRHHQCEPCRFLALNNRLHDAQPGRSRTWLRL